MAAWIINTVVDTLNEKGISAVLAYPGSPMTHITQVQAAVSLEKLEYTARRATVLVTVMVPVDLGGTVCEDTAIQVGEILETLGGVCVQEDCRFNSYADAFYVRVLGTFTGTAVLEEWSTTSGFTVTLAGSVLRQAVAFKAEQAVDEATGTPLSTAVWTFRLEEKFSWGENPLPSPTGTFSMSVARSGSTEIYNECTWISVELEDTATGLRQVRQGVAKSRSFVTVID